jgi:SAM-dependent methyltransferase
MEDVSRLSECLCCSSTSLTLILDLGVQPLCNAFHTAIERPPAFPLKVVRCDKCTHTQLLHVVSPRIIYADYTYRTGVSSTLVQHFHELAHSISRSHGVGRVLDVGCNDGTLLRGFKKCGCETWGVDPHDVPEKCGVDHFVCGFFGSDGFNHPLPVFDVITATNVLAHAPNPKRILAAFERVLAQDGVVVIEVPDACRLFQINAFDTIYFEHISYFTVASMTEVATQVGLSIESVASVPVHGGSLRVVLKRLTDQGGRHAQAGSWQTDSASVLTDLQATAQCRLLSQCTNLTRLINSQRRLGRRVVGFGASGKSSVILNAAQIDLDFIVDQTPTKIGKLTPGRDIPIIDLTALPDDDIPTDHVIFVWNCLDECLDKLRGKRTSSKSDGWITYVPEVAWAPLHDNDASQPATSSVPHFSTRDVRSSQRA